MNVDYTIEKDSMAEMRYNLSYYGADYPVYSLVRKMKEDEFIFPNFQRQYVWKIDEASKFIESLLLGLPVPSIFLAKDKYSGRLIVIDGQQRLRTIQLFYEGIFPDGKAFKLRNVFTQINGLTYQDLSAQDRRNLDDSIIHCLIISENENSNNIFYLFERLNTTGTPLTKQEIRNAIYHGPFNDLLSEFSSNEIWKKLYHKEEYRLEDQELILRFLAFRFEFDNYSGNLNEFLNWFMLQNRSLDAISKNDMENEFYGMIELIFREIGESAFYHNKQFNRSLFETLSLFVSLNIEKRSFQGNIEPFYKKLIDSEDFWQLSKSSTTSKKNIQLNIDFANYIFEIVNK